MFASFLEVYGGGLVVGVERDPPEVLPPFERFSRVDVHQIVADTLDRKSIGRVVDHAQMFDLIVVDTGVEAALWSDVLDSWCALLATNGVVTLEDASGIADVYFLVDEFLLTRGNFTLLSTARVPFTKFGGAALERQETGEE